MNKKYVGLRQAALIMGVPYTSLWAWISRRPKIMRYQIAGTWAYRLKDVMPYKEAYRGKGIKEDTREVK